MKKYFSLLIAVLMISAIICGCSQNTDQPSNGSNDEPVVIVKFQFVALIKPL